MNDFNDPNSQIPYDGGNAEEPRQSQEAGNPQSDQIPSSQQYMQYQSYDPRQEQPYGQAPQPQYEQGAQPQYGQGAQYGQAPQYEQPQYGQPQYGQPQYGQTQYEQPQYGQSQPQYGQPQYGQSRPQYGQAQYGQPQPGYSQQYGQFGYDQQAYRQMPGYQPQPQQPAYYPQPKSKLAAGLLGIFLGALGVHNFYLGYTGKAVAQLLLTLVGWVLFGLGPVVAWVWGLIESILILCSTYGSNWHRDAKGFELSD